MPILIIIIVGLIGFFVLCHINGYRENGKLDKVRDRLLGKYSRLKWLLTWIIFFASIMFYWSIWYDLFDTNNLFPIILWYCSFCSTLWASVAFWGCRNPEISGDLYS